MMGVSQLHIFTILALFPAFLHAPPLLRSFDFSQSVASHPPTIVAFLLFQVRHLLIAVISVLTSPSFSFTDDFIALGIRR
jgi:STE24 endopeptidase